MTSGGTFFLYLKYVNYILIYNKCKKDSMQNFDRRGNVQQSE